MSLESVPGLGEAVTCSAPGVPDTAMEHENAAPAGNSVKTRNNAYTYLLWSLAIQERWPA